MRFKCISKLWCFLIILDHALCRDHRARSRSTTSSGLLSLSSDRYSDIGLGLSAQASATARLYLICFTTSICPTTRELRKWLTDSFVFRQLIKRRFGTSLDSLPMKSLFLPLAPGIVVIKKLISMHFFYLTLYVWWWWLQMIFLKLKPLVLSNENKYESWQSTPWAKGARDSWSDMWHMIIEWFGCYFGFWWFPLLLCLFYLLFFSFLFVLNCSNINKIFFFVGKKKDRNDKIFWEPLAHNNQLIPT